MSSGIDYKKGIVAQIPGLGPPKPYKKDTCELCALERTTGAEPGCS